MDQRRKDDDPMGEDPLLAAIDAERRRLAGELHDGLGQALTGVLLLSSATDGSVNPDIARQLSALTAEAAGRTRGLSQSLDPSIGTRTLAALLSRLAEDLGRRFHRPFSTDPISPAAALNALERHHLHHAIVDGARYAVLHKGVATLRLTGIIEEGQGQVSIHAHHRYAEPTIQRVDDAQACLSLLHRRLDALQGEVLLETAANLLSLRLRWPRREDVEA